MRLFIIYPTDVNIYIPIFRCIDYSMLLQTPLSTLIAYYYLSKVQISFES